MFRASPKLRQYWANLARSPAELSESPVSAKAFLFAEAVLSQHLGDHTTSQSAMSVGLGRGCMFSLQVWFLVSATQAHVLNMLLVIV